jgi:hypothetical protein
MRVVRYTGVILLAYALLYCLDYGSVFIHRQDFDRAFVAWVKNPTPENRAALDGEQHINHLIRMHDGAIIAAIEVGLASGFWAILIIYYKHKRGSSGSQTTQ